MIIHTCIKQGFTSVSTTLRDSRQHAIYSLYICNDFTGTGLCKAFKVKENSQGDGVVPKPKYYTKHNLP